MSTKGVDDAIIAASAVVLSISDGVTATLPTEGSAVELLLFCETLGPARDEALVFRMMLSKDREALLPSEPTPTCSSDKDDDDLRMVALSLLLLCR